MTDGSSKIDVRRLEVGDLLIKLGLEFLFVISIPVTWHIVILRGYNVSNTVAGSRQKRQFHGLHYEIPSGVVMQMNKP